MTGTIHIVLAMKPMQSGFAENAQRHGVAGINIDGCRVMVGDQPKRCSAPGWDSINERNADSGYRPDEYNKGGAEFVPSILGRFPANVIHDGSDLVLDLFPQSIGMSGGGIRKARSNVMPSIQVKGESNNQHLCRNDSGSAARFFKEVREI